MGAESMNWKAYPDLKIELWDTPGQEALGNLRALAYPNCKIFIIGYACDELKSLNNICPDGEDGKPKEESCHGRFSWAASLTFATRMSLWRRPKKSQSS